MEAKDFSHFLPKKPRGETLFTGYQRLSQFALSAEEHVQGSQQETQSPAPAPEPLSDSSKRSSLGWRAINFASFLYSDLLLSPPLPSDSPTLIGREHCLEHSNRLTHHSPRGHGEHQFMPTERKQFSWELSKSPFLRALCPCSTDQQEQPNSGLHLLGPGWVMPSWGAGESPQCQQTL